MSVIVPAFYMSPSLIVPRFSAQRAGEGPHFPCHACRLPCRSSSRGTLCAAIHRCWCRRRWRLTYVKRAVRMSQRRIWCMRLHARAELKHYIYTSKVWKEHPENHRAVLYMFFLEVLRPSINHQGLDTKSSESDAAAWPRGVEVANPKGLQGSGLARTRASAPR